MNSVKVSLEDINELIKYFAFEIQLRIEELHKKRGLFFTNSDHHIPDDSNQTITSILSKYSKYESSETVEVKIIKKFTERILQIFQFFKQKYNSHSENLLSVIENRIKSKLEFLVSKEVIPVGEVLAFAFSLTSKSALISILKYNSFQKQKGLRQKRSLLISCSTSIKISLHSQPDEEPEPPEIIERRNQNQTELSKTEVTKNHLDFERIKDQEGFKFETTNEYENRPFTSNENRVRYKRSDSSSNEIKNWRKYSISHKKPVSYLKLLYKEKEKIGPLEETTKKPIEIENLYVNMNIDKRFVEKMLEKKEFLFKDMQKRNEKILNKMKKEMKKEKLDTENNSFKEKNERYSLKLKQEERSSSYKKLLTEHNNNVVPETINKKQSFRNMIYQNHFEKKKKCLDSKNSNRKSIGKYEALNDKENLFLGM